MKTQCSKKKKKKNEIFPYATILMKLEGIMLSEISQRKKNTACSHLHVEFYFFIYLFLHMEFLKLKPRSDTENRLMATRGGGWEVAKMGERESTVQNSICKINKSWGCNVQQGDYS